MAQKFDVTNALYELQRSILQHKWKFSLEDHIHHAMAVNSILFLSRGQCPDNLSPHFNEEDISATIKKIELMYDFNKPRMQMTTITDMISITQNLNTETIGRDKATVKLLELELLPNERKFTKGILELVKKLPRVPITEFELRRMFRHSVNSGAALRTMYMTILLTEALLSNTLDKDLDWEDADFVKLSRIVNNMVKEIKLMDLDKCSKAIDVAELQLLQLANDVHPFKKAIVKGIINMIGKLPTNDLKDEGSLGENELSCTFFDPLLSRLIANPLNNVHLRWSDIMAPETARQRPDAVISKINQLSFGSLHGFGESKIQCTSKCGDDPTEDNACSPYHMLAAQPDFASQKTALHETVIKAGHLFALYP
ncbi:hypothetical protein DFQ30_006787, partial [Apophysomyces sp. BC1015]